MVNDAVRLALAEEAVELAAFVQRAHEPDIPLADVLNEIAVSAREAIRAYQAGELKPQSADEVIADLRASLVVPTDE